jgi:hypothetical protein
VARAVEESMGELLRGELKEGASEAGPCGMAGEKGAHDATAAAAPGPPGGGATKSKFLSTVQTPVRPVRISCDLIAIPDHAPASSESTVSKCFKMS